MNTNSNINEETIYDNASQQQVNGKANAKSSKKSGNGEMWKKVAIGGATGIVMGTAGAYGMNFINDDSNVGESADQNTSNAEAGNTAATAMPNAQMAHSVNDDMSFDEAFAAARHEVGAGGVFEWHGHVYNTYYADEWDSMTPSQRDTWASNNHHSDHNHTPEAATDQAATETASGEGKAEVSPEDSGKDVAEVKGEVAQDPSGENVTEDGPSVEILGVYHDYDSDINYAELRMDDHEAVLVDVDNDQVFDMLAIDVNDNGEVDEGEMVDISDSNLTVDNIGGFTDGYAPDDFYANETDNNIDGIDYAG